MIGKVINYSLLFIFLMFLQAMVLNNIHMSLFLNPYVYILLIILLPFETPGWLVLSISFALGLVNDAFSNSLGMHAAACVLIGFLRKYLLILFAPRDGYERDQFPHYSNMGFIWFLLFAGSLTFAHHLFLFLVEDFRFAYLLTIIPKAFLSAILSMSIMLTLMLFSYKPR